MTTPNMYTCTSCIPYVSVGVPIPPHSLSPSLPHSRATAGPRPMDVYLQAYLPRLVMSVVFAAIVWITPYLGNNGEFPIFYYIIIVVVFGLHQVQCTYTVNNFAFMIVFRTHYMYLYYSVLYVV